MTWISRILREGVPEFIRFACVGAGGFVVDVCLVYASRSLLGIYAAGVIGYVGGSILTWFLNRSWTFRTRVTTKPSFAQWLTYLAASSGGFVLNRGAFFCAVTFSPLVAQHPWTGVVIGSIAGLMLNFTLNRAVVFRLPSVEGADN